MAQPVYNAKTLPLGDPNIAAANYGVDASNSVAKFNRLYSDRKTVDGGSKTIYDKMVKWASPEQIKARGGNPNDAQWSMMRQALSTGKVDPKLNPDLLRTGLGLGLSETARAQQHKPQSLLSKIAGPLVTLGLGAIPVIGPYAAAGFGGYMGQKNGGGVLGGLLGAAGGYLGGKAIMNAGGVTGIYDSAKNGLSNLFGSGGFSNPSALGLTGSNLALPGLANATAAVPVAGYGAGALGLGGSSLGLNFASGALQGASAFTPNLGLGYKPTDLYASPALGEAPVSRFPTGDRIARGIKTAGKVVDAFSQPPQPQMSMTGPQAIGRQPTTMAPHGAVMRPLLDYPYPNNPFMARIV